MSSGIPSSANSPENDFSDLPSPDRAGFWWRFLHVLASVACAFWFRLQKSGLENVPERGGALMLVNHQSFLDPVVIGTVLRRTVSFVARDTLFKVPVIGFILRRCYVMPVRREAATSSTIREAVRRIKHGFLVGLYPEGTRSKDGQVGRFKPGFLSILKRAECPVIPAGIAGTYAAMPRGTFLIRPQKVYIVFGTPVTYEEIKTHLESDQPDQELVTFLQKKVIECQQQAEALRTGKAFPPVED